MKDSAFKAMTLIVKNALGVYLQLDKPLGLKQYYIYYDSTYSYYQIQIEKQLAGQKQPVSKIMYRHLTIKEFHRALLEAFDGERFDRQFQSAFDGNTLKENFKKSVATSIVDRLIIKSPYFENNLKRHK